VTNLKLNGVDVADGTTYMVAVNNFLADGGDNFAAFKDTPVADRIGGGIDLDQLNAYLGNQGPIAPPGTNRVNELP
jgi:5'-nucleotidase